MPTNDTDESVVVQLDRVKKTVVSLLTELKTLDHDSKRNSIERASAIKKNKLGLTLEEHYASMEEYDAYKEEYEAYIKEWRRIGLERIRVQMEARGVMSMVWGVLAYLEIDYPNTRGFERKFQDLIDAVPDDTSEWKWALQFLMDLDDLLRTTREAVGENTGAINCEPENALHVSSQDESGASDLNAASPNAQRWENDVTARRQPVVPAKRRGQRKKPAVTFRRAIVSTYLDLSAGALCRKFDADDVLIPSKWKNGLRDHTWVGAYKKPTFKKLIDSMISKDKQAVRLSSQTYLLTSRS